MPLDFKEFISLLSDFCCLMKVKRRLFGRLVSGDSKILSILGKLLEKVIQVQTPTATLARHHS